jgi:hypothetical protein
MILWNAFQQTFRASNTKFTTYWLQINPLEKKLFNQNKNCYIPKLLFPLYMEFYFVKINILFLVHMCNLMPQSFAARHTTAEIMH